MFASGFRLAVGQAWGVTWKPPAVVVSHMWQSLDRLWGGLQAHPPPPPPSQLAQASRLLPGGTSTGWHPGLRLAAFNSAEGLGAQAPSQTDWVQIPALPLSVPQ